MAGRLPGLTAALDGQRAVQRLEQRVVAGAQVVAASAGSIWVRDDGSCSLRYRVDVAPGGGVAGDQQVLLARVFPSEAAAEHYADGVRSLVPGSRPPAPWREWVWRFDDAPVVVHPFPIDPDVPTLAEVAGLEDVRPEGWPESRGGATSMEVVRHPREGGVVLRYRGVGSAASGQSTQGFYAKVYPDSTGATVHRFLSSVNDPLTLSTASRPVRLPGSLGYLPDLRLLLTGALPGSPVLPALVRDALPAAPGGSQAAPVSALRAAVQEAGRVLAALHGVARAAAPTRTPDQMWRDVSRELDVVRQTWPETAEAIRTLLSDRLLVVSAPAERVLCHGDYTPSQILFLDGHASGLLDFDTVCWGDPAMDLGRFLAHLDLLLAKTDGFISQPLGQDLREDFLSAYEASARRRSDGALVARVDAFRTGALAVSALHACRQLKARRLDLALSLLRHQPDQPASTTRPGGTYDRVV